MDEILLRRLVGALTLLLLALLLSVLLPAPERGGEEGVTYEFNGGRLRPVTRTAPPSPPPAESPGPSAEPTTVPPPQPSGAVTEAPGAASNGSGQVFYVQIGTFREPENAERALQRMRRAGHAGHIEAIPGTRSTMLHRVRLGPFPDEAQARAVQSAAEAEGFGGSKLIPAARP